VHVPLFPKLASLLLETLDFTDVSAVPGSGIVYDLVLKRGPVAQGEQDAADDAVRRHLRDQGETG